MLAFKIDPEFCTCVGNCGVGQSNGVIQNFARPTFVAMATKINKCHQKVGYNSACV